MTGPLRGTAPFFLLTFALTWGLQIPGVLAQRGLPPGDAGAYMPLAGVGILGPLVAATVMSHREGGRATVMALFGGVLKWRVRPRWYAAALLLPGALLMGGLFVLNLAGRQGPTGYFPAPGAVAFAIVVSVAEEIGWRGYARPRLQARWGVFGAAALLGDGR